MVEGRPLRVLFLAPDLRIGGAERQWEHLLRGLGELGTRCQVLTTKGRGPIYERVTAAGTPTRCLLDGRQRVVRDLLRDPPDVVVARATDAHALAWMLRLVRGTPYVVAEHARYDLHPLITRRRLLLRLLAPRARTVVAVTESQRGPLRAIGYRPWRITVIPNGVPDDAGPVPRSPAAARPVTLALVAGLRPEKRVADFVDVVASVADSGYEVRGVVAGGGDALAALRERADARGAPVRFLGEVSDPAAVWRAADVACLTSEAEAMPLSLLEAMSFGLPLVVTDVGSNATLCTDGSNGFVHGVGDVAGMAGSVVRLVTEPDLRTAMGARSRARFEAGWSARAMTRAYHRLLLATASGRVSPGPGTAGSG